MQNGLSIDYALNGFYDKIQNSKYSVTYNISFDQRYWVLNLLELA